MVPDLRNDHPGRVLGNEDIPPAAIGGRQQRRLRHVAVFAAACVLASAAIAQGGTGRPEVVEVNPTVPGKVVANEPTMSSEWLAEHDVPAPQVDFRINQLPTALGVRMEVTARTTRGMLLAVKCQNADSTQEKPKFVTNPVDRVVLDFDRKWFVPGEQLKVQCDAGGQRKIIPVEVVSMPAVNPRAGVAVASTPA